MQDSRSLKEAFDLVRAYLKYIRGIWHYTTATFLFIFLFFYFLFFLLGLYVGVKWHAKEMDTYNAGKT